MENEKIKYIDKSLVKIASEQDVFDILVRSGEPLIKVNGIYRHREHDSLVITPQKGFYWFSQGFGSRNPIDFFVHVKDMEFKEAVMEVLNLMNYDFSRKNVVIRNDDNEHSNYIKKDFILPDKDEHNKNVYAYLTKTRGLDKRLVNNLIEKGLIYQDAKFKNAVFVGKDFEGNIVSAFKRSTFTIKKGTWNKGDQDGSQKDFRFRIENPNNNVVNIFESEIDLLSYVSMQPEIARNENYLSLGGVTDRALAKFLEKNKHINHINICTDNDVAGHNFCEKYSFKYGKNYYITREVPRHKDFNEDLLHSETYQRNRIEVLIFDDNIKNMSRKDKIRYINEVFNEKYQGCKVKLSFLNDSGDDNKEHTANINRVTKRNFRHKDNIETYKGFRDRLNMGIDKNLIELIENSNYIGSKDEEKVGQNSLHKENNKWHYFAKPLIIEESIYNMIIDIRENEDGENFVHKIRFKNLSFINEIENDESSQTPSTGILKGERPSFDIPNDTQNSSESQVLSKETTKSEKDMVKTSFSFSKDEKEVEF